MAGRKESSYITQYGPKAGAKIYEILQKQANQASQKAKKEKQIRTLRDQTKKLRNQLRQNKITPCV